jgi:hypothetical protein
MGTFLKESGVCELASWKRYCHTIAQSRFLRGENDSGFRVTFDWALNPSNASKVLEGVLYDKPKAGSGSGATENTFVEKPWADYVVLLQQHCTKSGYPDSWLEACKVLVTLLGQATFEAWFKEMVPAEKGDSLELTVKTPFLRDYIGMHHEAALEKAVQAAFPPLTSFVLRAETDSQKDPFSHAQALPALSVNQAGEGLKAMVLQVTHDVRGVTRTSHVSNAVPLALEEVL